MSSLEVMIERFGWSGVIMSALATYIARLTTQSDLTRKEQEARLDKLHGEILVIQRETITALAEMKTEISLLREDRKT